jgi:adenylylsulfate kinase
MTFNHDNKSLRPPVSLFERETRSRHRAAVIWMTGLSGAGKSTLAHAVERLLFTMGCNVIVLDGDRVRHGLCADLGYSLAARTENVRRLGELAKLLYESGHIVLVAAISPIRADRERARTLVEPSRFIEVHCSCPLHVCERRDAKGLYARARAGALPGLTGIDSPYEEPVTPDLDIDSSAFAIGAGADMVLAELVRREIIFTQ